MDFQIREAQPSDYKTLHELTREMADFLGGNIQLSAEELREELEDQSFNAFLIAKNDDFIGYAVWSYGFHTYDGKFMYIDDIYLREQYRGQGIGDTVMKRLSQIALDNNCKNIEWLVGNDNEAALKWFDKLGSSTLSKYQYRRLSKNSILELLN